MSVYSSTTNKINRIQTIVETLPQYAVYFGSERYSWVTPDYINQKITGAKEYFQAREHLAKELKLKTLTARQKRYLLEDLTRAVLDMLRAHLHLVSDEGLEQNAFSHSRLIEEKSSIALYGIDQFIIKAGVQSAYIDFPKLKTDLESAFQSYMKEKADYDTLKAQLETEKQEFLQKEDEIDDLYNDLVNALEGALHEDREVLLALMPWRVRKSSVVVESDEEVNNV